MAGTYEDLRELFVKWGADVDPETDLLWRTWEKPHQHELSVVTHIKNTIDDVNKAGADDPINRKLCASPIYNRIIHIFHKMEFVVRYFAGEFQIQCEDKYFREQFANVWVEFIRGWYFGTIYVGYGEDFKLIDDIKLSKDGQDPHLEGVPGRFRLYTKSKEGEFYSIFSRLSGIKFNDEQRGRLVKCDCSGLNNWLYWWYLWIEWLDGMDRFSDSIKWLSKQAVLTPKNSTETESIIQQGEDTTPFLVRSSSSPGAEDGGAGSSSLGKTKFDEIEVMNNETPMKIFEAINRYFEINASHLGFAGKVQDQKKERINAGENFPHQKVVSNVRTYLISSLNLCFDRMRAKFGEKVVPEDLKIVPSNQTFAQGLPEKQFGGNFQQFGQDNEQRLFQQKQQIELEKKTGND